MRSIFHSVYIFGIVFIAAACSSSKQLDQLFTRASPYEKYLQRLQKNELDRTALGADWLKAGKMSLEDSLLIEVPYHETGYFPPEKPKALSLRYPVQEGQQIHIALETLAQPEATIFIDVFSVEKDSSLELIHSADTLPQLQYEVEESGWHALRIQPELLRGGAYKLNINFQPSLAFPVSGIDSKAVGSFFGAPRDGGKRSHKGIDIFAPKGTPVLAVSDGVVGHRMQSGLGGKVVWLSSLEKRFRLYYAHLDSQAVKPGQRVSVGDTLGFVGNTGNARTTPPHLHFSIYKISRGAVDPYPFVHALLKEEQILAADPSEVGIAVRTSATLSNIRKGPTTDSEVIGRFPQYTWLNIEGKSNRWYRVALPDEQKGFIHDSLIEPLDEPTQQLELSEQDKFYFDNPYGSGAVRGDWIAGNTEVLANYDSLLFVRTSEGHHGWIDTEK
ncbi:murein DD-endopeptidase MepM/ murein hydrolase activator NlpD [Catalinimonas alkaloidigena]|uniref:M23 family metallopeptidase n=1 Tax=Catalinimonas alkaloidigena TaxID=1075417 RepID=UPI00240562FB|nr:M23 family metallopeptidase [Catalinimonas alkaloidigena]MDF9799527.1 murein DD-endopeptidase MepM/ murein hydrolase activator NlpD [Catalinimonas alkaloidigena]